MKMQQANECHDYLYRTRKQGLEFGYLLFGVYSNGVIKPISQEFGYKRRHMAKKVAECVVESLKENLTSNKEIIR